MRLRLGRPRSALVVAPHPDDEVIGAYGLMRRLRRQGVRIEVLVVTDGSASHTASTLWPKARLIQQRRRETRWALAQLGIRAGAIHHLGLPDGGLERRQAAAGAEIQRFLRRRWPFDLIIGPVPQDDHPDHRMVAAALAGARGRARRLGYPVWPRPQARASRTLLVPGGASAKAAALRLYRSQTGMIRDDPRGFALTPAQAAMFTRPIEHFVELRR